MTDKNNNPKQPDATNASADQAADLERHVDAMMDTKLPDEKPAVPSAPLFIASDSQVGGETVAEQPANAAEPVKTIATKSAVEASEQTERMDQSKDAEPPAAAHSDHKSTVDTDEQADEQTDALVQDIISHDSDELLAAHDSRLEQYQRTAPARLTFGQRLRSFFGTWWHNKFARYGTLLVLLAGLGALAAMPTSRYYALNSAGVRSAASLRILDNTTQLPLKNVSIEIGNHTSRSNQDGVVKLSGLPLGTQSLSVSQPGFSTINKTITLGWGSNPLGEFTLEAVGRQFRFKIVDYLTNKPIIESEISRGDANAQADKVGEVVLTIDQKEPNNSKAVISAKGYRSESINLENDAKQSRTVAMVPEQKQVYISRQNGAYDLYKVDVDGRNKKLLLAASGFEDSDISVVSSSSGEEVALVSRRDATKNQDGYPLQSLTIVDTDSGRVLNLDHSERIQIIDWLKDRLVYIKIKAGTSAGNPERYQLMSYDYKAGARIQLATANYFSDVVSAKGNIYYAASNNFQGGASQFVKIGADNTGKQVLLDKTDVWSIARVSYDNFSLAVLQASYAYKIGDDTVQKTAGRPANPNEMKFYVDAPDAVRSLWTETRDGKGVLLVYNTTTRKDTVLTSQPGMAYPVRWLNARTVVYRVTTSAETADYVVSLDGGAPKKIVDVTNRPD